MKAALVFGGTGALGRAAIEEFSGAGFRTVSVDFAASEQASRSVRIPQGHWGDQLKFIESELAQEKFEVVFCAAGGWSGGGIGVESTDDFVTSVDRMLSFNLLSALQTARVASKTLTPGGLLVLTGAAAALGGTGGMVAYGVSKAATHQLIQSVVDDFGKQGRVVLGLLPITLDTPPNRASMPKADHSSWTPLSFVAKQVLEWGVSAQRPPSGSLHRIVTEKSVSRLEQVHQ